MSLSCVEDIEGKGGQPGSNPGLPISSKDVLTSALPGRQKNLWFKVSIRLIGRCKRKKTTQSGVLQHNAFSVWLRCAETGWTGAGLSFRLGGGSSQNSSIVLCSYDT